ncbi:hemin uptake protein HemP [Dokdonella sp.]|uniref:hemin uptake protein HemP n=1 Tax=Dokdonella sp. TaxID=2291710 RepID=UPI003C5275BA
MLSPNPSPPPTEQTADAWQAPGSEANRQTAPKSRVDSSSLLQGGRELLIAHAGQEYRLRLTRNDKLILTK